MNRRTTLAQSAMTVLCLIVAAPGVASGQSAKDLVGTWTLVSTDTVRPDGGRIPTFGDTPNGLVVFTSDGHFIYLYSRGDLPKFVSNNRTTGTPEENKAVVHGSIATFGTYSFAGTDLLIKVEHISELDRCRPEANDCGHRRSAEVDQCCRLRRWGS